MKIKSIRGVKDILPGEIAKWQWVEGMARDVFSRYGFKEIRVPIFESTSLFARGIGETSDIVEKEMYTFEDRGGEQITLRPEGTASVVRAYIENKMHHPPSLVKVYYMGPMFRYERPQAGRFRQFYQIGVEAMGSDSPLVDAETMGMLIEFFKSMGLNDLQLEINSLGCKECRPQYRETLKNAIRQHLDALCNNCQQRYERNPLRVLDCKVEEDRKIAESLPKMGDSLCDNCQSHFTQVQSYLTTINTPFSINPLLVRGLDYYSRTTFEVTSSGLGSQNALCGGGRYDDLVEEFDGPSTPCFGFALGLERLISVLPAETVESIETDPDLFIVCLGAEADGECYRIAHELRRKGLKVERDYEASSMKSQMRKANNKNCAYVLIVGENELKSGTLQLKNMKDGQQNDVSLNSVTQDILNIIPLKNQASL